MKYIHYGHSEFDTNAFVEISNREYFNKPIGGLWASPIDAEYGWKQWCESEQFRECSEDNSFIFELKPEANIYQINCSDDVYKLPLVEYEELKSFTSFFIPNFEKIKQSGIDAIQFNLSKDTSENWFESIYYTLYGWDCDSIIILNKNIIKVI